MVGRLVEQEQPGPAEQQLGQRDAHLPAARERFGRLGEVVLAEAEAAQHRGDAQVDAVAVVAAEALLQLGVADEHRFVLALRHAVVAQPGLERVHLGLLAQQLGEGHRRFVDQRPAAVVEPVLRQVADGEAARGDDLAGIGLVDAGQHPEQGGLAGPVRAAQADPFPVADLPGDVVEEDAVAEGLVELRELDHGAAGGLGTPYCTAPAPGRIRGSRLAPASQPPAASKHVTTMTSDEDLVARSIDGDTDSFNQLVKRWERPIYALAYRTLGRDEDARDVTQETFLRAFRSIGGFRGQAKFSSWLYRIALNLCRDWLRKQRRAPVVQAPEGIDIIELASEPDPGESIEDVVARQNLSAHVQRAMAQLSEEQRSTIILKEYQGLTFQEIADLQGCPLSTVKTRLYQGLTVLRRELDRQGIESLNGGKAERPAPAVRPVTSPARTTREYRLVRPLPEPT